MIKIVKHYAVAAFILIFFSGCAISATPSQPIVATVSPATLSIATSTATLEPVLPTGKVIYLAGNSLYQLNLPDQNPIPLTAASEFLQGDATGRYLASTPDGKTLFFSGYDPLFGCSTFRPVFVCAPTGPDGFFALDTTNQSVNLIRPYTISNISLSPDGNQFAYTVLEFETTDYQVHLNLSPVFGGEPTALTSGHVVDTFPSWSPDGKWIAFLRTPSPDPNSPECTPAPEVFDTCTFPYPSLYIIHPDGSGLTKLLNNIRQFTSPYNQPGWSSDSQTLAVVSGSPTAEITLVNISKGTSQKIEGFSPISAAPTWSPIGSLLIFTASGENQSELILYNAENQQTQKLTVGSLPVWSPDAKWLLFTSAGDSKEKGLTILSIDGQTLIDLHIQNVTTKVLWIN
jgi:Tol biopolymer transport system component